MNFLIMILAVLGFTVVGQAAESNWPSNLAQLSPALQSIVKAKVSGGIDLSKFNRWQYRSTVGEHALVEYGVQTLRPCADGSFDHDYENVTLFVEGDRIKDVNHWKTFGCHED